MEGYPLTNFDNYNISCSNDVSIFHNSDIQAVSWLPLITMKEELINHIKDTSTNDIQLDETEQSFLDNVSNTMIEFMKKFKTQLTRMNDAEQKMKEAMNTNNKNIDKLSTFIQFLETLHSYDKCSENKETIEKELLAMSTSIKNDDQLKQIKETYMLEYKRFHKYVNMLKLFNQMNVGTTCSICLEENVDSYFNPCGHTACAKCCEKTLKMTYNDDACPLCRKPIQTVKKLYII